MTSQVTKHLVISGRVQGVYYRESLREQAENYAVTGWVRNRRDGTVEATLQGSAADVDAVIAWCRRGPAMASVENVEIRDGDGHYSEFERLGTL